MSYFFNLLTEYPIISVFLMANLGIGFWAHMKRKAGSFEDYALASRSLPTGVLVMTLLATFLASGDLAGVSEVYSQGILRALILNLQFALFLLVGTFITPYLVYFSDSYTLGDMLGKLYGRVAQLFSGIVSCLICLLIISTQMNTIGMMSQYLLGIDSSMAILLFGSLAILYSLWGGMRAVSYTDVLQAFAAFVVFTLVLKVLVDKVGGVDVMFSYLPDRHKSLFSHPEFSEQMQQGVFWVFLPTWLFTPPIVQRMLVTGDKRKLRKVWYTTAFVYGMICVMLSLIGLYAYVAMDRGLVKCTADNLFFSLAGGLFAGNTLVLSIVFIGVLAVLLSTIDSFLHAIGVSFVQDIIVPLRLSFKRGGQLDERKKVFYARIVMFCVGALAVVMGYFGREEISNKTFYFYVVLVSMMMIMPLLFGILGIKPHGVALVNFWTVYVGSLVIFHYLGYNVYGYTLVAMVLATMTYFIAHIYLYRGIVTLERSQRTIAEQLWVPSGASVAKYIKGWVLAPLHWRALAARRVLNTPTQSLSFSVLMLGLYTLASVVTGGGGDRGIMHGMAGVYGVGIALCCGLMLEGVWMDRLKPYFPLYWFFTLLYCLPFGGTLTFLGMHGGGIAVAQWVSSFILLALLVDSKVFLVLGGLGVGLARVVWLIWVGALPDRLYEDIGLMGGYMIALLLLGVLLFGRYRERYVWQRFVWNRTASSILGHDLRPTLQMLNGVGYVLERTLKEGEVMKGAQGDEGVWLEKQHVDFLTEYADRMISTSHEASKDIDDFIAFIKHQVIGWFERKPQRIGALIEETLNKVKETLGKAMHIKVVVKEDFEANVVSIFPQAVLNILRNASIHGEASEVSVVIEGSKRMISIRDNGKGILPEVLPRIFDLNFTTREQTRKNSGIGLAFVKMVVDGSSGTIVCHSRHGDGDSFTEFVITFPKA